VVSKLALETGRVPIQVRCHARLFLHDVLALMASNNALNL
jgi:hypothetical protein